MGPRRSKSWLSPTPYPLRPWTKPCGRPLSAIYPARCHGAPEDFPAISSTNRRVCPERLWVFLRENGHSADGIGKPPRGGVASRTPRMRRSRPPTRRFAVNSPAPRACRYLQCPPRLVNFINGDAHDNPHQLSCPVPLARYWIDCPSGGHRNDFFVGRTQGLTAHRRTP